MGRRKKNRERCVRGRSGAAYELDRLAAARRKSDRLLSSTLRTTVSENCTSSNCSAV